MVVSSTTKRAYSEVDYFLSNLSEETRDKIPQKILDTFKTYKDQTYVKTFDPRVNMKDQNFMKESFTILAVLNYYFWCDDVAEKEKLREMYRENGKKMSQEIERKLNELSNTSKEEENSNDTVNQIVVTEKKSFWRKFIEKVINIFQKK